VIGWSNKETHECKLSTLLQTLQKKAKNIIDRRFVNDNFFPFYITFICQYVFPLLVNSSEKVQVCVSGHLLLSTSVLTNLCGLGLAYSVRTANNGTYITEHYSIRAKESGLTLHNPNFVSQTVIIFDMHVDSNQPINLESKSCDIYRVAWLVSDIVQCVSMLLVLIWKMEMGMHLGFLALCAHAYLLCIL
jgi:hypothetical protein